MSDEEHSSKFMDIYIWAIACLICIALISPISPPINHLPKQPQEISDHVRILCASVILDSKPDHLQQYLANAVYEACRGNQIRLSGFPDFSPLIQGLKEAAPEVEPRPFQVCVKRGPKLVVLGSLANKWLQSEQFGPEANALVEDHNKRFNVDGDFVEETAERTESI